MTHVDDRLTKGAESTVALTVKVKPAAEVIGGSRAHADDESHDERGGEPLGHRCDGGRADRAASSPPLAQPAPRALSLGPRPQTSRTSLCATRSGQLCATRSGQLCATRSLGRSPLLSQETAAPVRAPGVSAATRRQSFASAVSLAGHSLGTGTDRARSTIASSSRSREPLPTSAAHGEAAKVATRVEAAKTAVDAAAAMEPA